ncbi:MAG: aspartate--tRNA ligase [Bdellovibrionales bacterium]|jgi:aspartyl-tRNA synthetase|nr:aspartate--tRNA ligase [Bdellovibrionales bacterium]
MTSIKGLLRTHHCGQLNGENVGQEVILCGWVNKVRNLGGLHFIDIRDKFGLTQLSFSDFKDDIKIIKEAALESVIMAKGKVSTRPEEAVNKNMKTGEVEVLVSELKILSKCDIDKIPFLPFGQIEATEDHRLKYRYLDLRTEKLQNILKLRSETTLKTRLCLDKAGFVEVETPILYKSTPEGARDYIVPSRVHPNKVYALPQSPQTLKQLLMIGGTDKYFQITKCFRDEDLRADRQPEFTQIDIEVSFSSASYIKNLCEFLLKELFPVSEDFTLPSMTYQKALEIYGSDKPDTRFELKHMIVTDLFTTSDFKVFSSVVESNGLIKAIFVPARLGQFSRKDTDGFTEVVKPYGGKGVAFYKVDQGKRSAGISKFISDEIHQKLESLSEEKGDGTWLFFADSNAMVAHNSADALRRYLGQNLNLIGEGYSFLWVHDFPLLDWDEDTSRFVAMHHPFTSPKMDEVEDFLNADVNDSQGALSKIKAEAYDVVCNGYEIGGGSVRIYDDKVQSQMFKALGMSEEETKAQFGFFVEALKYGTPPHGGIAFGLDRIMMLLAKTDSIRDVIAFPKTTSASDLMAASPSAITENQLKELNMKWR